MPAIGIFVWDLGTKNGSLRLKPWRAAENELQAVSTFFRKEVQVLSLVTPAKLQKRPLDFDYAFDDLAMHFVDKSEGMIAVMQKLLTHPEVQRCVITLETLLAQSVYRRVSRTKPACSKCIAETVDVQKTCPEPYISVLFSGGIDCTILALLADRFVHKDAPIELINVSFGTKMPREWLDYTYDEVCDLGEKVTIKDYNTPDRKTSKISLNELKRLCPDR